MTITRQEDCLPRRSRNQGEHGCLMNLRRVESPRHGERCCEKLLPEWIVGWDVVEADVSVIVWFPGREVFGARLEAADIEAKHVIAGGIRTFGIEALGLPRLQFSGRQPLRPVWWFGVWVFGFVVPSGR